MQGRAERISKLTPALFLAHNFNNRTPLFINSLQSDAHFPYPQGPSILGYILRHIHQTSTKILVTSNT